VNKIAVSLAPADTSAALAALTEVAGKVEMAEIRLDRMASFDLHALVSESPCQLILTCRSVAEGGFFPGSEKDRLAVLVHAMRVNAAFVDVEWNSIHAVSVPKTTTSRIIVSHHRLYEMPSDLFDQYVRMRSKGDCVKLVGYGRQCRDIFPVLRLLKCAASPVIAITMGPQGVLTRLLAPCFENCFLTYAAANHASTTASGQMDLHEMLNVFHLDKVGPHTQICAHLVTSTATADEVIRKNLYVRNGEILHVAQLLGCREDASELISGFAPFAPHVKIQPVLD
jgi:3-dehydroquinate dehydratase type I